jgi:hypothetical protein
MKCKIWKNLHFEKFIYIQQWLTYNMWSIGAIMCIFNNKLKKISFKKHFIWKSEKMTKKDSQSFCKVIPLAPFYVLVPSFQTRVRIKTYLINYGLNLTKN